jgi:hypothetical protein
MDSLTSRLLYPQGSDVQGTIRQLKKSIRLHQIFQEIVMLDSSCMFRARAHNTCQNLNTGISVFLIYETGIPVFQKQTFFQYILMTGAMT